MEPDQISSLKGKVDAVRKLASFATSEGGQLLIDAYTKDVLQLVKAISSQFRKLSHTEFIALAASLSEKMEVISLLRGAPGDFDKAAEDLKIALEAS